MTIGILTDSYPPKSGGIAGFYEHLGGLLTSFGHRVVVLTVDPFSKGEDQLLQADNLTLVVLAKSYQEFYRKYRFFFRPGGQDAPHWLSMGFAMRQWLLQNTSAYGIDLLEVSDYGGLAAFVTGEGLPPYVITAHSSLTQLFPYSNQLPTDHTRVLLQMESMAWKQASAIIAHSPLNKESVEKTFGRAANFARAPWIPPSEPSILNEEKGPVVIGGLQNVKGAISLAEALAQTNLSSPVRWIGYDTFTAPGGLSMRSHLEKKYPAVWKRKLDWLDEMPHASAMLELAQSSFLIIPSLWETFNYTALEAAAMKKAIIITHSTGASYLFEDGRDALVINQGDLQAMKQAIEKLDTDKELREKLGANAHAKLREYFRPDKIYQERMAIYEKAITDGKPQGGKFEDLEDFLENYTTARRKLLYTSRALLKKWWKPDARNDL